ncbi:hypothetical protein RJ639_001840 [Escallonia herrerae]|uniref:RING-type domain-containing protein n=1 Tax=Escallonia herrerae TaxID=1293975 RepID=A0AA88XPT4_9ASTE|nr:hypothetical protein RJ639_001840 [Escallonia herrerae]
MKVNNRGIKDMRKRGAKVTMQRDYSFQLAKGSEFPVVRCFQPKLSHLRGLVLFQYRLRGFTLLYIRAEHHLPSQHPRSVVHRNSISPENKTPFFTETPSDQPNNMPTRSTTSPRSSSLSENPFTGLIRYVSVNCFFLKVSGGTCSICHEDFVLRDMVNRLPCSHIFHTRCILRWLKRSNTCPLCRSKVHKEEPARPKETHGQPIRIMRLNRESFHRVPTSQSRPAPTSRNVTRSVENEAHILQSRPTPTARNVIPSVQNEDHGDAVSCVTLDEAGDTVMIDA